MKYEEPKDMFNTISHTGPDGKNWVINSDKINEYWHEEYKDRLKFLDLSLAIEGSIDQLICARISEKMDHFLDRVVLTKMDFSNKILIMKTILSKDDLYHNKDLRFEIGEDKILVDKLFKLHINKTIQIIEDIREVRNHSVHSHQFVFGRDNKILKRSKIKPLEFSEELDKEELLIKGHFVLWILNLFTDSLNHINKNSLLNYYTKYESILKTFAEKIESA